MNQPSSNARGQRRGQPMQQQQPQQQLQVSPHRHGSQTPRSSSGTLVPGTLAPSGGSSTSTLVDADTRAADEQRQRQLQLVADQEERGLVIRQMVTWGTTTGASLAIMGTVQSDIEAIVQSNLTTVRDEQLRTLFTNALYQEYNRQQAARPASQQRSRIRRIFDRLRGSRGSSR